jgi:hypothetical protein
VVPEQHLGKHQGHDGAAACWSARQAPDQEVVPSPHLFPFLDHTWDEDDTEHHILPAHHRRKPDRGTEEHQREALLPVAERHCK